MKDGKINLIKSLLNDHRAKHSDYQIENFIIGSSGDTWFQYKQALREIQARYDSILNLREDKILCAIEIADLCKKAKKKSGNRIKLKIAIDRKKRQMRSLKLDYLNTWKELDRFLEVGERLKKELGEIDEKKRALLEANSWFYKAKKIIAIDVLTSNGHLSRPTLELLFQLPMNQQRLIVFDLRSGNIKNLLGFDPGFKVG